MVIRCNYFVTDLAFLTILTFGNFIWVILKMRILFVVNLLQLICIQVWHLLHSIAFIFYFTFTYATWFLIMVWGGMGVGCIFHLHEVYLLLHFHICHMVPYHGLGRDGGGMYFSFACSLSFTSLSHMPHGSLSWSGEGWGWDVFFVCMKFIFYFTFTYATWFLIMVWGGMGVGCIFHLHEVYLLLHFHICHMVPYHGLGRDGGGMYFSFAWSLSFTSLSHMPHGSLSWSGEGWGWDVFFICMKFSLLELVMFVYRTVPSLVLIELTPDVTKKNLE